jgi:peroxiredoxin
MCAMTLGQTTVPATRPSTIGKIAASAADAVPLGKGARLPKLTLKGVDGKAFDLYAAVAKKPTVLIFYRGGWCPYCMRQLSGMEGVLEELTEGGFQLIAISPDNPEELAKTAVKEQLTYTLLSDSDAAAMRAFGLAFQASPTQFELLERYSGTNHHALPVPAVYFVDANGTIKFVHSDPDFKTRMNPSRVVEQATATLSR